MSLSTQDVIQDILNKELGQNVSLSSGSYSNWFHDFTVDKKINSKQLIEEIASASPYIPRFNSMGEFLFTEIPQTGGDTTADPNILSSDVIDFSFTRTKIEKVYTKIFLKYKWNYTRDGFDKGTLKEVEYDYPYDYYGLKNDNSESTFTVDDSVGQYIRDGYTAARFLDFMVSWHKHQHLKMKIKLPLKYMNLEIGDTIIFDKLLGGIAPYGIDYTVNSSINGNQNIYRTFMIFSTNKTLEYVEIEAMQLHEITLGTWDADDYDVLGDGEDWEAGDVITDCAGVPGGSAVLNDCGGCDTNGMEFCTGCMTASNTVSGLILPSCNYGQNSNGDMCHDAIPLEFNEVDCKASGHVWAYNGNCYGAMDCAYAGNNCLYSDGNLPGASTTYYQDTDGDGVGDGNAMYFCEGYSGGQGTTCADPDAWGCMVPDDLVSIGGDPCPNFPSYGDISPPEDSPWDEAGKDCNGVCGGGAIKDDCGDCSEGDTGNEFNANMNGCDYCPGDADYSFDCEICDGCNSQYALNFVDSCNHIHDDCHWQAVGFHDDCEDNSGDMCNIHCSPSGVEDCYGVDDGWCPHYWFPGGSIETVNWICSGTHNRNMFCKYDENFPGNYIPDKEKGVWVEEPQQSGEEAATMRAEMIQYFIGGCYGGGGCYVDHISGNRTNFAYRLGNTSSNLNLGEGSENYRCDYYPLMIRWEDCVTEQSCGGGATTEYEVNETTGINLRYVEHNDVECQHVLGNEETAPPTYFSLSVLNVPVGLTAPQHIHFRDQSMEPNLIPYMLVNPPVDSNFTEEIVADWYPGGWNYFDLWGEKHITGGGPGLDQNLIGWITNHYTKLTVNLIGDNAMMPGWIIEQDGDDHYQPNIQFYSWRHEIRYVITHSHFVPHGLEEEGGVNPFGRDHSILRELDNEDILESSLFVEKPGFSDPNDPDYNKFETLKWQNEYDNTEDGWEYKVNEFYNDGWLIDSFADLEVCPEYEGQTDAHHINGSLACTHSAIMSNYFFAEVLEGAAIEFTRHGGDYYNFGDQPDQSGLVIKVQHIFSLHLDPQIYGDKEDFFKTVFYQDIIFGNPDILFTFVAEECGSSDATIWGDLSGDLNLNVLDIVILANCILTGTCDDEDPHGCGDLNQDSSYNVLDIVVLAICILDENCSG